MRSLLVEAKELVARAAADLDVSAITSGHASTLLDDVIALERQLAALKLRLAHRAEESPQWKQQGFRSPEEWMARKTGTGLGAAARMFDTARKLEDRPETAEALASGEVSVEQAAEVVDAAAVNPAAERDLIEVAKRDGLVGVRREADRVKAAATDEAERYERIRRRRHLRRRTGRDGAFEFFGANTPDVGAAMWTELKKEADRIFDQARRDGRREDPDAYMADALANLILGRTGASGDDTGEAANKTTKKRNPPPRIDRTVFIRIDATALDNGHTDANQVCEVVGGGPVPVSLARSWCTDANLRLLLMNGVDVNNVVHLGRQLTKAQRTALYERAGFQCEVEGCTVTHGLEIDHVTEWHLTQHTRLDDVALICKHDHYLKTVKGYTLQGPPGKRRLVPPPQPPPVTEEPTGDDTRPDTTRPASNAPAPPSKASSTGSPNNPTSASPERRRCKKRVRVGGGRCSTSLNSRTTRALARTTRPRRLSPQSRPARPTAPGVSESPAEHMRRPIRVPRLCTCGARANAT